MGEAEEGAFGLVRKALNFPAVGENNLLHDREAKARPLGVRGEVGLEDFGALIFGHPGAVVGDVE